MCTSELLERLPKNVLMHVEKLRRDYNNDELNKGACRTGSYNYMLGLYDAGLITDVERRQLFIYTTI